MKTKIFALMFMASMLTGTLASAMNSKTILTFETLDGKTLEMEMYEEIPVPDDMPALIISPSSANVSDPENHDFFQALIIKILKPETEDPLPAVIR